MCGYLKSKICGTQSASLEHLRQKIVDIPQVLRNVREQNLYLCMDARGQLFKHLVNLKSKLQAKHVNFTMHILNKYKKMGGSLKFKD